MQVTQKLSSKNDLAMLQLTGAGGGGVAFTIVTPDTPEEKVEALSVFFLSFVCFPPLTFPKGL